mmetsp:Transcript_8308/g.20321  ORF Transcript_8308/g.20321 Transcript_8308/m.20321 type:complete len:223 (+) Transcript_8308:466-1134(+)
MRSILGSPAASTIWHCTTPPLTGGSLGFAALSLISVASSAGRTSWQMRSNCHSIFSICRPAICCALNMARFCTSDSVVRWSITSPSWASGSAGLSPYLVMRSAMSACSFSSRNDGFSSSSPSAFLDFSGTKRMIFSRSVTVAASGARMRLSSSSSSTSMPPSRWIVSSCARDDTSASLSCDVDGIPAFCRSRHSARRWSDMKSFCGSIQLLHQCVKRSTMSW